MSEHRFGSERAKLGTTHFLTSTLFKENFRGKRSYFTQTKKEHLGGAKDKLSEFDVYVNKDTKELLIFRKGMKGVGIPTGEYLK